MARHRRAQNPQRDGLCAQLTCVQHNASLHSVTVNVIIEDATAEDFDRVGEILAPPEVAWLIQQLFCE